MMMIESGGSPTPPTPVPQDGELEYIETDGISYIDLGVYQASNSTRAMEIKMYIPSGGGNIWQGIVGGSYPSSNGVSRVSLLIVNPISGALIFGWYYNYASSDGVPVASWSVENGRYFIVRCSLKKGSQVISLKEENDSSFRTKSFTSTYNCYTDWNYRLFSVRDVATSSFLTRAAMAGTRVCYCKMYSDTTFTTLLRDFVPYRYNGVVCLYDRVANNYRYNGNQDGTFIGGPNVTVI